MKVRALLVCGAVTSAVLVAGCQRPASQAEVKQTASEAAAKIKAESANAKDQLADAWITTKIKSKLVGDRDIHATDIDVTTQDGVVTLKGHVLSEALRQLATTLAGNTDGVKQVNNQLAVQVVSPQGQVASQNRGTPGAVATTGTVESATPSAVDDGRIASMIQSKYFTDDRIKGRRINVTSSGGVVTLSGEVADETERAQALLLARSTDGVTRVEDALTVSGGQQATSQQTTGQQTGYQQQPSAAAQDTDSALSSRIQSQLSSDNQVKGSTLEVTAKNGVVLLQGTVASAAAKQRALTLARGADGVTQVVDRIQVGKARK